MANPGLRSSAGAAPCAPAAQVARAIELSIVMPCLNEAETLGECIRKASAFLDNNGISGEIVVGDNGSTDGSRELAGLLGARVVAVPLRGYGAAIYHASLAARGHYVIVGDSDDSYDFTGLMPFVDKLRAGYDLVMGNRFLGGIKPGAMPWKNRYLGNPALTSIGRLFFRSPASDFHCGLRGYRLDAFNDLDLRMTGMEFASEMVIKATLKGKRIAEVPTTLSPDGRSHRSHLRPWRDGWRHLRFMLLFSPNWLFFYPGAALILLGALLGGRLLAGPLTIGHVELDVHTLLYCAMLLWMGFQSALFSVFTKVFAIGEGLLPGDPLLAKLSRFFTLERGLAIGGGLMLLGIALSLRAVAHWESLDFGNLYPPQVLRQVIPAVVSVTLGLQVVLSSFFLSVLSLKFRRW
jgi:glycosyltransferase involved in cell wall biosynthesis